MIHINKIVKELLKYRTGTLLEIKWDNNYTSIYELDTFYDTDNGLEMDEEDYTEFHVALVKDIKKENVLLEIGIPPSIPLLIKILDTNEIIWNENWLINHCDIHENLYDCPDNIIIFDEKSNEYGIVNHDGSSS